MAILGQRMPSKPQITALLWHEYVCCPIMHTVLDAK